MFYLQATASMKADGASHLNYHPSCSRRTLPAVLRDVGLPFIISFYYRLLPAIDRTFTIKVHSTRMVMKMRLTVTGKGQFPIIDTLLLRRLGLYEPNTSLVLRDEIKPGYTVIELGAAYGYFTIQMSKYVGQNGMVISFEPNKEFYKELVFNLELNKCVNVCPCNTALSSSKDIFIDGSGARFETQLISEFMRSLERPVDFIFVDIDARSNEGNIVRQETGIIENIIDYATRTKRRPKVFLEYVLKDKSFDAIKEKLAACGYSVLQVTDRHFLFKAAGVP